MLSYAVCALALASRFGPAAARPSGDGPAAPHGQDAGCKTILETIAATPATAGLAEVVKEIVPELVPTLSDPETALTLFAPTDDARVVFDGIRDDAGDTDTAGVDTVLMLHVVPTAALLAEDLSDGQELDTLAGGKLTVGVADDGTVTVTAPMDGTTATVVEADLMACASVVHVIDTVLLPGEMSDAIAVAGGDEMPGETTRGVDVPMDMPGERKMKGSYGHGHGEMGSYGAYGTM